VRLLTNPAVLRAVIVLICAGAAFFAGVVFTRLLRRRIDREFDLSPEASPSLESLPLHLYNTVIQQLKQQKHELAIQAQEEQRRAQVTENFSQAVLSNLSCGVVVFGVNGLVKQSNAAGKQILGFASLSGMGAADVFRGASPVETGFPELALASSLGDQVHSVLREESTRCETEVDYATPGKEKRHIAVTVTPVAAAAGGLLGAACLISDLSEFERIRRQQELHGEISREKALDLRTSLTAIAGYAQQLASSRDPGLARQLAQDIADEAARLDRSIGGFLTEDRTLRKVSARAAANT
jgi:nitrogen fixation/metabolism regulation signal transduction histidine kinase